MWTILIDLLFYVFTKPNKKTPAIYVVALTIVVIGYAVVTIVTKSDFAK